MGIVENVGLAEAPRRILRVPGVPPAWKVTNCGREVRGQSGGIGWADV